MYYTDSSIRATVDMSAIMFYKTDVDFINVSFSGIALDNSQALGGGGGGLI